jgi:hypothetical protein
MAAPVFHRRVGRFFIAPSSPCFSTLHPHAQPFTDRTPRPIGLINPTHYTLDVHQWGEVREEEGETYNESEAGPESNVLSVEVLEEF